MRTQTSTAFAIACLTMLSLASCDATVAVGDRDGHGTGDGLAGDGVGGDGSSVDGTSPGDFNGVDTQLPPELEGLVALRIEPADVTLIVAPPSPATQRFTVYGSFANKPEADVTAQVFLRVVDPGLGVFQGALFTSVTTHGGQTRVQATIGGLAAEASLTLKLSYAGTGPETGNPLPANPAVHFGGSQDGGLAPQLVYPNDGVLLPPNVAQLELHWRPAAGTDLFELAFVAPMLDLKLYLRCTEPTNGGCIHKLDPVTYRYVAATTGGHGPIALTVRAADEAGRFGASATYTLEFAQQPVEGGVYYWTTSNGTAIMRFDFGDPEPDPEIFVTANDSRLDTCVGCHALSRDGRKMVMSKGGQQDGRIVFLDDVSRPDVFTVNQMDRDEPSRLVQFAAWDPEGSRFAAIYGDSDDPNIRHRIHFHDGTTALRLDAEGIALPWEPSHIEWSPDGTMLAMTRVGVHQTSQRPKNGGLELIRRTGGGAWGAPETVLPIVPGANRYNPSFAPDDSFMLFSESICQNGNLDDPDCDADSDRYAKTWAVRPQAGATPVRMARAGAPGVEDHGNTELSDTFPRFSPYARQQGTGRVMWATISSRRHFGLRDPQQRQLLWMFAMDPDRIVAGQDGSYPAFYVPYQDFDTSNHIAQWTRGIVRGLP